MRKSRTSVNQKAIQKVRLLDKIVNTWNYKLIHRKGDYYRTLPFFKKKYYEDDIYINDSIMTYTKTELIEMGNVIEDEKVYYSPCVIIFYTNGTENARYFPTFEEAEQYYKELIKKLILIEI